MNKRVKLVLLLCALAALLGGTLLVRGLAKGEAVARIVHFSDAEHSLISNTLIYSLDEALASTYTSITFLRDVTIPEGTHITGDLDTADNAVVTFEGDTLIRGNLAGNVRTEHNVYLYGQLSGHIEGGTLYHAVLCRDGSGGGIALDSGVDAVDAGIDVPFVRNGSRIRFAGLPEEGYRLDDVTCIRTGEVIQDEFIVSFSASYKGNFSPDTMLDSTLRAYLTPPGPRETQVAEFVGTQRRLAMEQWYLSELHGLNGGAYANLTVNKRIVNNTPLYEVYLDNGEYKPLMLFFHGGGDNGNKMEFMEKACMYAQHGFHAVCVDAVGYGESELGPIDITIGLALYVEEIDGLIEYYHTRPDVSVERFCLFGNSMGGFISFSYVAHGKYRPTVVACSNSTPNLVEMCDGPLYATTDHSLGHPNIYSREEIYRFAEAYSAIHYPERFLDVTLYTCNGLDDDIVYPTGCQQLEALLKELGGSRFTFLYMEDRGHGGPDDLEDFQPFDTIMRAMEEADR